MNPSLFSIIKVENKGGFLCLQKFYMEKSTPIRLSKK